MWLVAVTLTDRYLLTQFFYWFDTAIALGAAALIGLGLGLRSMAGTINRRTLRVGGLLCAILFLTVVGRTWGVFRWIIHIGHDAPPQGRAIRLVHWNLGQYDTPDRIDIGLELSQHGTPDIAFMGMQNNHRLWDQMTAAMSPRGEHITLVNSGPFKVFSRFPVRQTGYLGLSFTGADAPENFHASMWLRRTLSWIYGLIRVQNRSVDSVGPASVIAYEFDTTATLGRKTVAWYMDLPSNVVVSKAQVAALVAARAQKAQAEGALPAPDILIGDFNTPAGSASLGVYAPGFTDAVATSGLGLVATWPRPSALLHIDHILVSPSWRAADYRAMDIGTSEHMAQTALVWPAEK